MKTANKHLIIYIVYLIFFIFICFIFYKLQTNHNTELISLLFFVFLPFIFGILNVIIQYKLNLNSKILFFLSFLFFLIYILLNFSETLLSNKEVTEKEMYIVNIYILYTSIIFSLQTILISEKGKTLLKKIIKNDYETW